MRVKLPLLILSEGKEKRPTLNVSATAMEPEKRVLRQDLGSIGGLVVGDIQPGNPLFGGIRGAQILDFSVTSPSYMLGFERRDVIVAIDGNRVTSVDDLMRRIEQAELQYRLDIVRDGIPAWVRMIR